MSQDCKAILQQANAAIVAGDHEGFLRFCTEDTQWNFIGERTLQGKEAVRCYMAETYKEPPKFEVHELIGAAEFVTAIGEITLKDAAGNPVRHAYCDVWRFRDGKLAELRAFVIAIDA
jgi:ketosteroid isomerase-like protein